jgi:hypothetical protein|mmetsp:Transcript_85722/g.139011  ORF Transcript_85722/g.139011 Transcript_85722/m.139011 type:complete len:634 (+) Transcript_85722:27-1928(+)
MKGNNFLTNKINSGSCDKRNFFIISIIGPRQAGKTTLLKSIVEHLTKIKSWNKSMTVSIFDPRGSMTVYFENISDILSIINCIKVSDLIISIIDGFFGLELETFETVAIIRKSNFKRYVFIVTHLDLFKTWKALKKAKKRIKDRILKETDKKCKIFYFSGMKNNSIYFSGEIKNFTRYLNKIRSNYKTISEFQDIVLISKVELQKTVNQLFICCTGYVKKNQIISKQQKNCFIPGLGKATVLNVKKLPGGFNFGGTSFNSLTTSFNPDLFSCSNKKYSKQTTKQKMKKKIWMFGFCSFISNIIFFKILNFKKLILPDLVDSMKIFTHGSSSHRMQDIENLIENLKIINILKKRKKFDLVNQITLPISKFSTTFGFINDRYEFNPEKCYFRLIGILTTFRRYHDAHSFLFILFEGEKKKRLIVAKIIKNKWEKTILCSGRQYLISIGWKLILTKLQFCNQKNNDNFYVLKNLKNNEFSYICFYTELDDHKDLVIGIKTKRQIRNRYNQGTSFSSLFVGEVIFLSTIFKMFKRIKIKGMIFKNFKKTSFIKGMFHSNVEAIKFKGGTVKTPQGVTGIIKNVKSNSSGGIIRATFEKKVQNETVVTFTTFTNIEVDKTTKEIYFDLIPDDQRDLLY